MPVAAIVYGAGSTIIRRIVHCDSIDELGAGNHVGAGEEMLLVDAPEIMADGGLPDLEKCKTKVKAKKNKDAPSSRCAVADANGTVVDIIAADPLLDQISGKTIEQSDDAQIGWIKSGGKFKPPNGNGAVKANA